MKNIWIHVSYPSKLFEFNSEIDIYAKKRSSSIYLIDKCISMLPKNIIDHSNLKKNKVSETLSGCIELNENGSIKKYEITETLIKPNYEFTYEDTNEILELEPKEEYELVLLNKLLKKSYNYRKEKGSLTFNTSYTKILNNNNNSISFETIEITQAHKLVSEAMILMGNITSDFLIKNNIPAPFRLSLIHI